METSIFFNVPFICTNEEEYPDSIQGLYKLQYHLCDEDLIENSKQQDSTVQFSFVHLNSTHKIQVTVPKAQGINYMVVVM